MIISKIRGLCQCLKTELAVIIGKEACKVVKDKAMSYVFGYVIKGKKDCIWSNLCSKVCLVIHVAITSYYLVSGIQFLMMLQHEIYRNAINRLCQICDFDQKIEIPIAFLFTLFIFLSLPEPMCISVYAYYLFFQWRSKGIVVACSFKEIYDCRGHVVPYDLFLQKCYKTEVYVGLEFIHSSFDPCTTCNRHYTCLFTITQSDSIPTITLQW